MPRSTYHYLSFPEKTFCRTDIIFAAFVYTKAENGKKNLDGKDISFRFPVNITLFHKSLIRSFVYSINFFAMPTSRSGNTLQTIFILKYQSLTKHLKQIANILD